MRRLADADVGNWKGLAIRGIGFPLVAADAAKLAALKHFTDKGLAAGVPRPAIAKVILFDEIAVAHGCPDAREQIGKMTVAA